MTLSVIVTSYSAPEALRACLASLVPQSEATEIVVCDCSPEDPAIELSAEFPRVDFLHFNETKTVPELRWSGLARTSGEIIGVLEAQATPAPDWCARVLAAHRSNPDAAACAGPIAPAGGTRGLYLCEYVAFAPPLGEVRSVSGLNCSFQRADLEAQADLLAAGAWETELCQQWAGRIAASDALVSFRSALSCASALAQRYHHGRVYASRSSRGPLYAVGAPALPLILTYRNLRDAARKGLLGELGPGLGWAFALNVAWSLGEFAGYALGPPSRRRIW